ncbi:MAG: hypothetical protein ACE5MB_10490 [Anaerolineae bacterium]
MAYIVLIEQDWTTQALIKAQLEEEGNEVLAVEGLGEARALLRRPRPDLIILDTIGQGCSKQNLDDLRQAAGGVPIVLCTGPYDRARLDLEARDFAALLIRPFTIGELAERVQEVLRGGAGLNPRADDKRSRSL